MLNLTNQDVRLKILDEIRGNAEKARRLSSLKRHLIYKDGGKRFLLDQIRKEFDPDAIKEMRLAPINLLKKIVNKRSSIYSEPPMRKCQDEKDQALVDFYVERLQINQVMQKVNRYFNLFSNLLIYVVPDSDSQLLKVRVLPSYLYSKSPDPNDALKTEVLVLSAFHDADKLLSQYEQQSATGAGFNYENGWQVSTYQNGQPGNAVASNERSSEDDTQYIWWSNQFHATTDAQGGVIPLPGQKGLEHGLSRMPLIEVAKDRDNEPWALQGEDMIDLTMALQMGWTDTLTILKHQGYSLLTVVSEEQPKKLTLGVNRAIWLKANPGGVEPKLEYKSSATNLGEHRQTLIEVLALLLSTNNMNPKEIGGSVPMRVTSGFQALIEKMDTLEAIKEDKPAMKNAELELWEVISMYHNQLADSGELSDDAKSLGKFSDDFIPEVTYSEAMPIESEDDRLKAVQQLLQMGLTTRKRAMKKLYPDMSDDDIESELEEIDKEKQQRMKDAQAAMDASAGALASEAATGTSQPPVQGQQVPQLPQNPKAKKGSTTGPGSSPGGSMGGKGSAPAATTTG